MTGPLVYHVTTWKPSQPDQISHFHDDDPWHSGLLTAAGGHGFYWSVGDLEPCDAMDNDGHCTCFKEKDGFKEKDADATT